MIKLSIIIVNYNVKYFLEQAISTALKALVNIKGELIVVDNASTDGSCNLVKKQFPNIRLIENNENIGFAKANNLAIQKAKGKYILLLNPDTIVEEDTFEKIIDFMDKNPRAGGLGVKMIDGKGQFLPESKRSLPTPWVSFCKIFGLSALFPKSKLFSQYHLGYLDKDKNHTVDVLSGAFMLLRKEVLDKIGLLDETFFMYGEDIDLSYRITKAGYNNVYFSDTSIIHFKGESTKKGSLNYVKLFYKAMIIFAKKHFTGGKAGLYSLTINLSIYLKAILSIFSSIIKWLHLPIIDTSLIFTGMYFIKNFWEQNIKTNTSYPETFLFINVPIYIFIWLLSTFFSGGYDKPIQIIKIFRGIVFGTILVAAAYGFIDEAYRFSRGMIVLGGIWAGISIISLRFLLHLFFPNQYKIEGQSISRSAVIGSKSEYKRVLNLINQSGMISKHIGFITNKQSDEEDTNFLGKIDNLTKLVKIYKIKELIFCTKDITSKQLIQFIAILPSNITCRIVTENSNGVISSSTKNTSSELYAIDTNYAIASSRGRRNKRLIDISISILLIFCFIIIIIGVLHPFRAIGNCFYVLSRKKTWVGYNTTVDTAHLPKLKKGILLPYSLKVEDKKTINKLNFLYAKDYNAWQDVKIILKKWRQLGNE